MVANGVSIAANREREEFSERLKQALLDNHLKASPAELVRRFNLHYDGEPITTHAVRKWLVGEAIPTQDKLRTLAAMLDVSADWLRFGGEFKSYEALESSNQIASSDVRLITDLNKLDSRDQKLARDILRLLIVSGRGVTEQMEKNQS